MFGGGGGEDGAAAPDSLIRNASSQMGHSWCISVIR
jgi:hypothetical protein